MGTGVGGVVAPVRELVGPNGERVRLLMAADVAATLGVCVRSLNRDRLPAGFPEPVRFGRVRRWFEHEVFAFLDGKAKERAGASAGGAR